MDNAVVEVDVSGKPTRLLSDAAAYGVNRETVFIPS